MILIPKPRAITNVRWKAAQELEGGDWKTERGIVENEYQELINKFSALFPRIARTVELETTDGIIDVGCGPTVPARLLGVGKVTGVDPLADFLGITGTTAVPGVNILCAKAEAMPFPDASVDFVLCRNVIDHTQDPAATMREIFRVLKPGKFLLLICYTYAPFITFVKNMSERLGVLRNVRHPHTFTPGMLDALAHDLFEITERFTIYTGQHSTDYGKVGNIEPDHSVVHRVLTWINKDLVRSSWFLKEYGYLAQKRA